MAQDCLKRGETAATLEPPACERMAQLVNVEPLDAGASPHLDRQAVGILESHDPTDPHSEFIHDRWRERDAPRECSLGDRLASG
jgi:hypothetical protein